jgi:hypothetical protein
VADPEAEEGSMTDSIQSVQSDLAFMKAVVEDRVRLPWWLGAHLFAVGGLFGLNLVLGGTVLWPTALWSWLPASVIYGLVWFVINARSDYAAMGPSARSLGAVWLAVVAMSLVIVASLVTAQAVSGMAYTQAWSPIASTLYGGGWMAGAIVRRRLWMGAVALGCFATAIACAVFIGKPEMLVALGAGLIVFMAAPGFVLMRSALRRG